MKEVAKRFKRCTHCRLFMLVDDAECYWCSNKAPEETK